MILINPLKCKTTITTVGSCMPAAAELVIVKVNIHEALQWSSGFTTVLIAKRTLLPTRQPKNTHVYT